MWFLAKIKYTIQDSRGKQKSVSEQFLIDGIIYGEVETRLAKLLEGRVTDYDYDILKIKFAAVYDTFVEGDFYKVTIQEETTGPKGEPKVKIIAHLVVAEDVSDAERRAAEYMKHWITDTTIIGSDRTKILGVWHPHSENWQKDFAGRMADLASKGHESSDANQMSFDFEAKTSNPASDMQNIANKTGLNVTVSGPSREDARTFEPVTA